MFPENEHGPVISMSRVVRDTGSGQGNRCLLKLCCSVIFPLAFCIIFLIHPPGSLT